MAKTKPKKSATRKKREIKEELKNLSLFQKIKAGVRSKNPKPKNSVLTHKDAKSKSKRNIAKRTKTGYTYGKGEQKDQFTLWFPSGMAESKKLAFFASWNPEPIQKYIVKGRRWKKPVYEPQSVWVKLIKRQPWHSEYFYTAQLTPPDFVVNKTTSHEFAYMTLEQYYQDYVGHIKEKILAEPVQRFKSSSPGDYEGKPMKIEGIIFHFLYY